MASESLLLNYGVVFDDGSGSGGNAAAEAVAAVTAAVVKAMVVILPVVTALLLMVRSMLDKVHVPHQHSHW